MRFSTPRCRIKLKEGIFKSIIQFHDGSLVATAIAVVWCTKDGDNIPIMTPVVSLHNKLMGSGDQGKTVGMVESFGDVLSKSVSSTSGRDSPATTVIRI